MPDLPTVRSSFPSLSSTSQVFFDNAGGSQTLGTVISSVTSHYTTSNVQLGGTYAAAQRATAAYTAAFASAASFLNCDPSRLVFGPSATQLLRNLSHALTFSPGDEIVLSLADHESNISPWLDLAERQSLVVVWHRPGLPADDDDDATAREITALLTPRTRLVAITHASNVLGTVTPVRAIAAAAHSRGALVAVDGVALAPYSAVDLASLGADFYVLSWYKVFGPHLSTLYVSDAAFPLVRPLGHAFLPRDTLDGKLGLAAAPYELLQAVPRVVEYLGPPGGPMRRWMDAQHARVSAPLLAYLAGDARFRLYGSPVPGPHRVPVISFAVAGRSSREVVEEVERVSGFGLKWGHFYCPRLVGEVLGRMGDGEDGVVRVSLAHYNSVEEVEGFIKVLDEVVSARK